MYHYVYDIIACNYTVHTAHITVTIRLSHYRATYIYRNTTYYAPTTRMLPGWSADMHEFSE